MDPEPALASGMPAVPTQRHPVGLCRRYDRRGQLGSMGAPNASEPTGSARLATNLPARIFLCQVEGQYGPSLHRVINETAFQKKMCQVETADSHRSPTFFLKAVSLPTPRGEDRLLPGGRRRPRPVSNSKTCSRIRVADRAVGIGVGQAAGRAGKNTFFMKGLV